MARTAIWATCALAGVLGLAGKPASAQISLADDIIAAAKAKGEGEQKRSSSLGRSLGSFESPYRRRPGTTDVNLGALPPRRASLPRLARLSTSSSAFNARQESGRYERGVAPSFERLPLPLPTPGRPEGAIEDPAGYDEEGPPEGLTLDQAIQRLVHMNRDLRIKALELPQADADVLTAGLRENPLVFYGSDQVPYRSYTTKRDGEVEHGVSFVFPVDFMGKREKRLDLAKREKEVLAAQFQNAVRVAIDDLYTAYVDALVARQLTRAAEESLSLLDRLIKAHTEHVAASSSPSDEELEEIDDLTVERGVTEMAVQDAFEHFTKARHQLAELVEIEPDAVQAMTLRGKINVPCPPPPPLDALIATARERRPDLVAHRLGIIRARAEWHQERSERFSDAYFLYTPFDYLDRSQSGGLSVSTWGAGVFVSIPLFNRNQGNVRRAEINVTQSEIEADVLEDQVAGEVRHAHEELTHSLDDLRLLERETLPAVRRKRAKAKHRLEAGEIHPAEFLQVERQTTSLVRFYRDTAARNRRNMLRLNTAVGCRILP